MLGWESGLRVIFHLFSKDLVSDVWLSHVYTQRSSRPPVNVPFLSLDPTPTPALVVSVNVAS